MLQWCAALAGVGLFVLIVIVVKGAGPLSADHLLGKRSAPEA